MGLARTDAHHERAWLLDGARAASTRDGGPGPLPRDAERRDRASLAKQRVDDDGEPDEHGHPRQSHHAPRAALSRTAARLGRVGVERRRGLTRDVVLALEHLAGFRLDELLAVLAHGPEK